MRTTLFRGLAHSPATPPMPMPVLLLLTAGRSRRLGRPKAALVRDGVPLLLHQLRLARAAGIRRACVVLGAAAPRLALLLQAAGRRELGGMELRLIRVTRWREGMGVSLRQGLAGLPPDWRHALVMLVDQVGLNAPELRRLCRAPVASWVVRAAVANDRQRLQAPVVLPRTRAREARAMLRGDRGLAPWLGTLPPHQVATASMRGLDRDLDTPADARAWREARRRLD